MKENTKRYVKLSIILYIVILSVALVGTLAWFIYDKSATVTTEDKAKIVAGEYMEIKLKGTDEWVSEIELAADLQYPDISYDYDSKEFYYPTALDENDELLMGDAGKGKYKNVTNAEGYFSKIELVVSASRGMNVYLSEESFLDGVTLKTDDANVTPNIKDYVAGAARVAFFEDDTLKTVWIPNPNYKISDDGESVEVNGGAESEYKYIKVSDGTVNELGTWDSELLTVGNEPLASETVAGEAKPLLEFTEAGEKNLTIYIWVEGTDRESVTALAGGSIKYDLKLVGISKLGTNSLDINDVVYNNGELLYASTGAEAGGELLYSYNGTDWAQYSPSNDEFADGKEVVYVRAKETATELAGPVKEITLNV